MVNSDFVNPTEKLLDLQWCIPALESHFLYAVRIQIMRRLGVESVDLLLLREQKEFNKHIFLYRGIKQMKKVGSDS
jgi:hypothetical protein